MSQPIDHHFLLLNEAAEFLRCSTSLLYKRRDIPRHRRPGSRVLLFDRNELLAWAKSSTEVARSSQHSSSMSDVSAILTKVRDRNPQVSEGHTLSRRHICARSN